MQPSEYQIAPARVQELYADALQLLRDLICTPSFSQQEEGTAHLLEEFLLAQGVEPRRHLFNIWARNLHFDPNKPTILLNSHHDTVKPNAGYTRDPFSPDIVDGRLYGLGSNDAGGPLVGLIAAFLYFYAREDLKYNLILAATAEEENSGPNGLECLLPMLGSVEFAIVGEPTQMHLAIAEKGLLVLDCTAHGRAGHAAREEGLNALYEALPDLEWFRTYRFPRVSVTLGPVKMNATVIQAGSLHNMVPEACRFTVDIRLTDEYTHEEVLETVRKHVKCSVEPRSTRLKPSRIDPAHPIVQAGLRLGRETYGSPTCSDQALISAPSLKLGPGDSARSHTADEYLGLRELEEGIALYIRMLEAVVV